MNNSNNKQIVIRSALGYWSEALKKMFNTDDVLISDWEINIANFDKSIDDFKNESPSLPDILNDEGIIALDDYSTDEHLYVFIAPITWAARYQRNGFRVIGPAFGTKDSLSIFAGTYPYNTNNPTEGEDNNSTNTEPTIGTIGKYITSTALFEVYNYYIKKIFDINIHFSSLQNSTNTTKKESSETSQPIKNNFKYISEPDESIRFYHLKKDRKKNKSENNMDFAIFTIKEIDELDLRNRRDVRELLKIEPVLSHIFNIEYVPRTVYCIHESQNNKKEQLKRFHKLLMANGTKYDKPINGTNALIYPIDPENEQMQKIQNDILSSFKSILKDRTKNKKYSEAFEQLEFVELVTLIEENYNKELKKL